MLQEEIDEPNDESSMMDQKKMSMMSDLSMSDFNLASGSDEVENLKRDLESAHRNLE